MAKRRLAGTRAAGRSTTDSTTQPPPGPATEPATEPAPEPASGRSAGRRRARSRDQEPARATPGRQPGLPSVAEVAVYLSLAVVVAVIVLIANGRPWWHAAVVVLGAAIAIAALKVVADRTSAPDAGTGASGRARRRRRS